MSLSVEYKTIEIKGKKTETMTINLKIVFHFWGSLEVVNLK